MEKKRFRFLLVLKFAQFGRTYFYFEYAILIPEIRNIKKGCTVVV
jgi:hypothetical protein